jgi:hypothetical protein
VSLPSANARAAEVAGRPGRVGSVVGGSGRDGEWMRGRRGPAAATTARARYELGKVDRTREKQLRVGEDKDGDLLSRA